MSPVAPFPRWFMWYVVILSAFALAGLGLGVNGIYVDKAQNEADAAANAARDAETSRLLDCFDAYAAESSATSKAVRDAAVLVDQSQTVRDKALDEMFKYFATDPPENDPVGVDLFLELLGANAELVTAQAHLDQVRKENPVPDRPSVFCDLDKNGTGLSRLVQQLTIHATEETP